MTAARKRALQEADSAVAESAQPPSTLQRIRSMWQFANLFQFILLFGKALKLDDNLDIEDLEADCLKPGSTTLQDIGLGFLKFLSSHRGLTRELFDEYSRRQFLAKAPEKNPFGDETTPARFADFDIFTKIRVLQLMTQLIMMNPERLREKTDEQKDMDQTNWRIEPYGWDNDDRTYYVLDDNRIYRLTEAPSPPSKPKKNTKKAKAAQRASKRRRVSAAQSSDADDAGDEDSEKGAPAEPEDDGLGGMRWECVAVTLGEVRQFLAGLRKSKSGNERVLRDQIEQHLVPILEKQEESRLRKQQQREKELLNLEKMAHAKRSSRIAGKLEQQRALEQVREEERKKQEEEAARREEGAKRAKMEHERDRRLMSREQRLKEREIRRLQHEEELAQLSEESKSTGTGLGRMSERRRLAEIEKNKQALKELEEEEDDWTFDCVCGFYGQVDDGTHSVACERCNVWQHSKCLGIAEEEAEKDDFHFICDPCLKNEQALREQRPKIIKIKVNRPDSSQLLTPQKPSGDSPPAQRPHHAQPVADFAHRPPSNMTQNQQTTNQAPTSLNQDLRPHQAGQPNNGSAEIPLQSGTQNLSPRPSPKRLDNPFSSPHPNLTPPVSFDESRPSSKNLVNTRELSLANGGAPSHGAILGLTGSGNGPLPFKQPQRPLSPPSTKMSPAASTEAGAVSATLPQFTPAHPTSHHECQHNGSPLLPTHGGISPIKHSPPPRQVNGVARSTITALATVFPSGAAQLSPTPQPQILTPPVKAAEPARHQPQESINKYAS